MVGFTVDHSKMKLGKAPAAEDDRTLKMSCYTGTTTGLAPAPNTLDLTRKVGTFGMLGNDVVGDCAEAGMLHTIQVWTANAGKPVVPTTADAEKLYAAITGYDPSQTDGQGNNPTDNGTVLLDLLKFWRTTGFNGHKIGAFVSVNPRSPREIMDSLYYFGSLILGIQLPISAQTQVVWDVDNGPNGEVGSWGGHCVPGAKYAAQPSLVQIVNADEHGLWVVTWGALKLMTWAFLAKYADEAYALLSEDWICGPTKKTIEGFDLAQLQQDLAKITKA